MKTRNKPENRNWRRENSTDTERPTRTKNDRIMAGQNHNRRHRHVLMILSGHDSVCLPRAHKKRNGGFEQEATERTEIQKETSLFLTSVQICCPPASIALRKFRATQRLFQGSYGAD